MDPSAGGFLVASLLGMTLRYRRLKGMAVCYGRLKGMTVCYRRLKLAKHVRTRQFGSRCCWELFGGINHTGMRRSASLCERVRRVVSVGLLSSDTRGELKKTRAPACGKREGPPAMKKLIRGG